MYVKDGILVLEKNSKECRRCQKGYIPGFMLVECDKCKGTGRRGSGRCRKCNRPGGYIDPDARPGKLVRADHDNPVVCPVCHGNYVDYEDDRLTDTISEELYDQLEWQVMRTNRAMSWGEQYLGGDLGSCVDYGRHKKQTDEELIEHEKNHSRPQATALVDRNTMRFAKGIVIVTADQGYTKKAYWADV